MSAFLQGERNSAQIRALALDAIESELSISSLAQIHQASLEKLTPSTDTSANLRLIIKKSGKYFQEFGQAVLGAGQSQRRKVARLEESLAALKRNHAEITQKNIDLKNRLAAHAAAASAWKKSAKEHARGLAESKRLQQQLRHLSHQVISAQEEDRKKISRELHDEISSTLAGISIELNLLETAVPPGAEKLNAKLARTQQLVLDALESIHRFARELRPATLDDLGLIPALHSFTKALSRQTGLRINLTIFAGVEELELEKRTAIFRVVQEALNNVAKHAQATKVEVSLMNGSERLTLVIQDNGKSFRAGRVLSSAQPKRLGLLGMRERIEMLGGTFSIESRPELGTTVRGLIPNP